MDCKRKVIWWKTLAKEKYFRHNKSINIPKKD